MEPWGKIFHISIWYLKKPHNFSWDCYIVREGEHIMHSAKFLLQIESVVYLQFFDVIIITAMKLMI